MTYSNLQFDLITEDGYARAGKLFIKGQEIETPVFMPVGTNATVKAITVDELKAIGYRLILANTYHLFLRPGDEIIRRLGGLHDFMNWDRCILTDSGGFQVFSLGGLNKVDEEGVIFKSHLDGSKKTLTPELAINIQENLGSDIMMVLDECLGIPAEKVKVAKSIVRTTTWAKRSLETRKSNHSLFAIVQGAEFEDLRVESAQRLLELPFDGYAIGGLSVGEDKETMYRVISLVAPLLPLLKPRYLMGIGDPVDILNAIEFGVDMFDCVIPTRNARNGCLFTFQGKLSIKQAQYKEDPTPIDENCRCEVCRHYSKAYLRHLYLANEILASRLNSYHNLWFFQKLLSQARQAIVAKNYKEFKQKFLSDYK